MAFINTADKYGDDVTVGMMISGTLPEYRDDTLTSIRSYGLGNNEEMEIFDAPQLTSIATRGLSYCTVLEAVILRNTETIASLGKTDALTQTPIAKGTGYIYVPRALVDSYKSATNWSTYAAQFRALEDYTVDGTVTGDLDETKI